MKHIKTYKVFESTDLNYSDRDFTNKYFTSWTYKGWIRYTDAHQDSYIDIEKYFDITWDHLGWILEDLVNKCDLLYKCRAADSVGLSPGAEDYGKFGTLADHIVIDLIPESFEKVGGHSGINFKTYISKFTNFPPKDSDVLFKLLQGIEDKLGESFPYLTIKDYEGKWNFFITTSQITLKIKRI